MIALQILHTHENIKVILQLSYDSSKIVIFILLCGIGIFVQTASRCESRAKCRGYIDALVTDTD